MVNWIQGPSRFPITNWPTNIIFEDAHLILFQVNVEFCMLSEDRQPFPLSYFASKTLERREWRLDTILHASLERRAKFIRCGLLIPSPPQDFGEQILCQLPFLHQNLAYWDSMLIRVLEAPHYIVGHSLWKLEAHHYIVGHSIRHRIDKAWSSSLRKMTSFPTLNTAFNFISERFEPLNFISPPKHRHSHVGESFNHRLKIQNILKSSSVTLIFTWRKQDGWLLTIDMLAR